MDPRTVIASRIDLQLRQHLDVRLDVDRALTDADYMRDVLLVCDAMRRTRLPLLARQFRVAGGFVEQARRQAPGSDAGPPQPWAADTSGFGLSRPLVLDAAPAPGPAAPWYSLRRWRPGA